nr:MAG TPA: InsA C-terminal domain [Caudoviricetes sp.]
MTNDIKELIKYEYENGTSIRALAEKYNQKVGTIKSWISREKWVKKKENSATIKKKNATTKRNQLKMVANDKEVQIKSDIINNVPKEKVMEKHGIKKSAYYDKAKSIRQMRLEATEKQAQKIIDEVYYDLPDFLRNIAIAKRNTAIRIIQIINKKENSEKEVAALEKKLSLIVKTEKEIMRTGKLLTNYELLEVEAQLVNEGIQSEKVEIEKSKLNSDISEDNKIEIKLVGI